MRRLFGLPAQLCSSDLVVGTCRNPAACVHIAADIESEVVDRPIRRQAGDQPLTLGQLPAVVDHLAKAQSHSDRHRPINPRSNRTHDPSEEAAVARAQFDCIGTGMRGDDGRLRIAADQLDTATVGGSRVARQVELHGREGVGGVQPSEVLPHPFGEPRTSDGFRHRFTTHPLHATFHPSQPIGAMSFEEFVGLRQPSAAPVGCYDEPVVEVHRTDMNRSERVHVRRIVHNGNSTFQPRRQTTSPSHTSDVLRSPARAATADDARWSA